MKILVRSCFVILFISWIALPSSVQAEGIGHLYDNEQPLTLALRKEIATDLLELISAIDRSIPTLSPSEQAWVESEQAAIDTRDRSQDARLVRFHQSNEATITRSKWKLSQIIDALNYILNEQTGSFTNQEVVMWSAVSHHLRSIQLNDDLLRLVDRNLASDRYLHYRLLWSGWGEVITERIVWAYLNDSLPK